MGFFTDKANEACRTTLSGERLFCPGKPSGPAYVIPDAVTERRLRAMYVWKHCLEVGIWILGMALLLRFSPNNAIGVLGGYAGVIILASFVPWAFDHLILARELRGFKRKESWSFPCDPTAQRHRRGTLVLGFLGSLVLVLGGVFLMCQGNLVIGIITVIFFGLCAFACDVLLKWDREIRQPTAKG